MIEVRKSQSCELSGQIEYDWEAYACIVWNQLLSLIQTEQSEIEIILEFRLAALEDDDSSSVSDVPPNKMSSRKLSARMQKQYLCTTFYKRKKAKHMAELQIEEENVKVDK